jgi:hypothetical protein
MKSLNRIFVIAGMLVASLAMVSCGEKEDGGKEPVKYFLEFKNEADALKEFAQDFVGTYEIEINTNIPKASLKIADVEPQTWCSADLNEAGDAIVITPGASLTEQLTAKFALEAVGLDVEPLQFEVVRLYEKIEYTVKVLIDGVECEGDYPMYEINGSQNTVAVTVQTNAQRWNVSYDYYSDDEQWFSLDKASGRNEETCTFTFGKNESASARNQSFVFRPDGEDTDTAVTLTFVQSIWSIVDDVTVRHFNNSTMTAGEVIKNNQVIELASGNTARSPFCFVVEVDGVGGVAVMFAEPGSNEFSYTAPGEWMFGGAKDIDPENPQAGKYFYITTLGNGTGASRSMDAVLTAGNVELFRFKFTQVAS